MMHDFIYGIKTNDVIAYDIETYPNVFTLYAVSVDKKREWYFEVSDQCNDVAEVVTFLLTCGRCNVNLVGYNNLGFDYPVVHWVINNCDAAIDANMIYNYAMAVIRDSFAYTVWPDDRLVHQIDLYKINHFDNKARATSLKVLEFNMRMDNIEDLPFPVGTMLSPQQIEVLKEYNRHDVMATVDFYHHTLKKIKFRAELTHKYQKDFMNHNDTKIGKDYFIMELEKRGIECYEKVNGRRQPRQTVRDVIPLSDIILPCIQFSQSEFNRSLNWFKSQRITETKGVFTDVSCTVRGFQFDFGTGGIHGSIESARVEADEENTIIDIDVASYYPNLAIANELFPAHLGREFCTIYKDVYEQRKQYAKGTAENAMLKLALNGVYGDSNNKYSPFYDPQYTMSITINGQLLLCMLAERLMDIPGLEMIQINTDGLTVKLPRVELQLLELDCQSWEHMTGLTLEQVEYSRMFIRDVNNYIAETTDGKIKRKGAYEYELDWHQNQSALVVAKAAEAHLLHGDPIDKFICSHSDSYDFYLRAKVPRNSMLEWGGERVPNITRYYICEDGKPLEKVMPPKGPEGQFKKANGVSQCDYDRWHKVNGNVYNIHLHTKNQSRYEERRIGINTGWCVQVCNEVTEEPLDINYEWYIKEAEKLCKLGDK
jgi:hypothetical protein